jgi:Resolvase, N terminal domain
MGYLLGYARVSATDQQPQLQVDALERAGCYRVFTETASGARADRPTLAQVLDQLRPGDTLVVWKLDRLGRSLRHLVDTVTGLAERGIGFRSLQEAIDTTTPGGKLVFHVFARLGRVRTRPDPRAHGRGVGRRSGPGPPRRPTPGADRAQAGGCAGDVPLGAVQRQRHRHDPWGQPGLDLPLRRRLEPLDG